MSQGRKGEGDTHVKTVSVLSYPQFFLHKKRHIYRHCASDSSFLSLPFRVLKYKVFKNKGEKSLSSITGNNFSLCLVMLKNTPSNKNLGISSSQEQWANNAKLNTGQHHIKQRTRASRQLKNTRNNASWSTNWTSHCPFTSLPKRNLLQFTWRLACSYLCFYAKM